MADQPPVFIDVETTGLDPDRHVIWEVALIDGGDEYRWVFDIGEWLGNAEPDALRVNRFYERTEEYREIKGVGLMGRPEKAWDDPAEVAFAIAVVTEGRILVGKNTWFDAAFLTRLLRHNRVTPAWDYHLVDVKTFAAGWLAGRLRDGGGIRNPPWDTADLCVQLGINPADHHADRHTALGDARLAKAMFEAVLKHG